MTPAGETDERVNNDLPWQLRAIGVIGVPSALAIYLVITMVGWGNIVIAQAGVGRDLQTQLSNHSAAMAQMAADQATMKLQNEIIIRILRTTCVNLATTRDARERCQD